MGWGEEVSKHCLGKICECFSQHSLVYDALHLFVVVLYKFAYHMCAGGSAFGHVDRNMHNTPAKHFVRPAKQIQNMRMP